MGDATVAVRLLRGRDLTYQRVRVPVMSFMRDFSIQWPVSVESMWTGAGTASSLPVHAGFIQCALQWSMYDRFLVAATTPITFTSTSLLPVTDASCFAPGVVSPLSYCIGAQCIDWKPSRAWIAV